VWDGAPWRLLNPMTPLWRGWAAVTVVMLAVLAVFVGLATLQFSSIHARLVGERLVVLAERTVAPFAAAVRLGLPLSSVRNAAALLERARQTDDDISALVVFDAAGRIVHTAGAPAGSEIDAEALRARTEAAGRPWFRETARGFVASVDIAGKDGAQAGGILVVYPTEGTGTQVRAMVAELSLSAIGVWLAASALAAGLLRMGLRRQLRHHERLDAACRRFESDTWRQAAGRRPDDAGATDDAGLHAALRRAEARYQAAGRQIAAAGEVRP